MIKEKAEIIPKDARDSIFKEYETENTSTGNNIVFSLSDIKTSLDELLPDALAEAGADGAWFRDEGYSKTHFFPMRPLYKILGVERKRQVHFITADQFKTSEKSFCRGDE